MDKEEKKAAGTDHLIVAMTNVTNAVQTIKGDYQTHMALQQNLALIRNSLGLDIQNGQIVRKPTEKKK